MDNNVVIIFNNLKKKESYDLEIPVDITANDLVVALNTAYELGIDVSDQKKMLSKSRETICVA